MTTFYAVCAGAAATLVGLLFVAVQIGPPLEGAAAGRRLAMARSTFTVFAIIFGLSLYFLVPNMPPESRGLAALGGSVGGVVRSVRTWLPVWRDKLQGRIEFRLWQTAWLLVGPVLLYAYLAFEAIRVALSADPRILDYASAVTFILLFIVGLRNSWNLLVEATNRPA